MASASRQVFNGTEGPRVQRPPRSGGKRAYLDDSAYHGSPVTPGHAERPPPPPFHSVHSVKHSFLFPLRREYGFKLIYWTAKWVQDRKSSP
ncbi:hypothetical protein SKAU_G00364600 [Synaphobranchus kaupii]|uniref:Uncharacterized protein n=1 Tax=Synaphobranchus kaupii TaxID=118154 RepID=A0A9Q1EEU8_SYNKA|nr:hypothetical protein SKAU_G00364600 [Synaphobranchus kaupii]